MADGVKVFVYCDPDPVGVMTFLRVPQVGEFIQTDSAMLVVAKVVHNAKQNGADGAAVLCRQVEHEHEHDHEHDHDHQHDHGHDHEHG